MTAITIEKFAGKMNRVGYDAFLQAMRQARGDGNRNVELCHWLFHAISDQNCDISVTLRESGLDRGRVLKDLDRAMGALQKNVTETPGISERLADALNHAWTYATLFFGEAQIRTGHLLVALLNDHALRHALVQYSGVFDDLSADRLGAEARTLWAGSEEEDMRPMDGSGLRAGAGGDAAGPSTSLGRFSVDMTADAAEGRMDPVVGRDDEIRQIIDVLMRRRQNNPILTGEAGVGKTAVVEGFAQKLASGEVPPALKGMRLHMLDIGAMQAGASMKGEFEQRLRSVIDEVQASPTPIILFIDEAHTLIGAGGAAGTGDAANLLKPALARGTLRTIGATTWAEYRNYFEKDPALTRRFQPISVDEPSIEVACFMMRGLLGPMEAHHKVRISDAAVESAVKLSARYLPARQLPDKAVSLLDTACARVAVSQSAIPARIADTRAGIAALEMDIAAKTAERDLGAAPEARLAELETDLTERRARLTALEAAYGDEKAIVDNILALRTRLGGDDADSIRAELAEGMRGLEAIHADDRMIWPHVDDQAVASVISDWTGIPAGRMVADELQAVLGLADHLKQRVIGQDEGLQMIARRVETARAGLGNPEKPIGVFMLCGPSGVGKTETALALAESLYGGEQNVITINMSEFQEAHSVSLLKGAPPGYVGYGEGGRLTEAVRRKPYSVVLLDEMEKAHPDVHELFFQVFDKGRMEDGNGRPINFRNTLILMTSNVGTGTIMALAPEGRITDAETLEASMKEELLGTFPPALLGRIVTIPYVPLSRAVLGGITRLKLGAVARRMRESQGAVLHYGDEVIGAIVEQCRDPDSGGRMIDNIITNSILPDLSRQVLGRMVAGQAMQDVTIRVADQGFDYDFN
ncbi:type VI secretion system protein VasG [Paracoccus alcaliphilus]|uniref:Type VI secretion system protein VasG n=1 Tax=Paracoccus alcaliphilus TaxID=34002 RepID=A0A1H8HGB7_9RHOB|nr:type VI secretion system ATPase TssH [Paracoccus alcaliphilus]WCR20702.1 type VI secretion system ATPase TssH [Paracoccus alcaliphilus]SEN55024.1 type VI secretion system protein VasG [Paracoccus alcaliphilus]